MRTEKPVIAAAILSVLFVSTTVLAQESAEIILPKPTGIYAVGTATWHWIDSSRPMDLTPRSNASREIMAQAWYPAASNSKATSAPYAPLYSDWRNVRGHSIAAEAFAPLKARVPIIVLCPGRGTTRHSYTAIAEDLASHGYFVLGVDSPYLGLVVYPDGRQISPSNRYRPTPELMSGPYEKVDELFSEATTIGVGDVSFALKKLRELARFDPARRFTNRLDFNRIGIFGHSLGGRIAGGEAARDKRIRAFASMEGVPPRDVRRGGMTAAVAMLLSSPVLKIAQPNYREVIPNRKNDVFFFLLEGFGHNSVTDQPLIQPGKSSYKVNPSEGLRITRLILLMFFDRYVRGSKVPVNLRNEPLVHQEIYLRANSHRSLRQMTAIAKLLRRNSMQRVRSF